MKIQPRVFVVIINNFFKKHIFKQQQQEQQANNIQQQFPECFNFCDVPEFLNQWKFILFCVCLFGGYIYIQCLFVCVCGCMAWLRFLLFLSLSSCPFFAVLSAMIMMFLTYNN